jgi:hypothetical protein
MCNFPSLPMLLIQVFFAYLTLKVYATDILCGNISESRLSICWTYPKFSSWFFGWFLWTALNSQGCNSFRKTNTSHSSTFLFLYTAFLHKLLQKNKVLCFMQVTNKFQRRPKIFSG